MPINYMECIPICITAAAGTDFARNLFHSRSLILRSEWNPNWVLVTDWGNLSVLAQDSPLLQNG